MGRLLELQRSQEMRHTCPLCEGGGTKEKSFAVFPNPDGIPELIGFCYRSSCRHVEREHVGPGETLAYKEFEPKPLRLPYRLKEFGLFGERELIEDPTVTVWQLYDINGRRTGHVLRTPEKSIRLYKEVPEPVYYSNGRRPDKTLWLFEDCKSAAMCDQPAVALLGTNLPISLLDHLVALRNRTSTSPRCVVYVALDPGAEDAAERVHRRLRDAGIEAVFVPMAKDFKDMEKDERETLLETYAR